MSAGAKESDAKLFASLDRESLHQARRLLRSAVGDLSLWALMLEDGSSVEPKDLRRVSRRVARALWSVENVMFSAGRTNVVPIRRTKARAASEPAQ